MSASPAEPLPHPLVAYPVELNGNIEGDAFRGHFAAIDWSELRRFNAGEHGGPARFVTLPIRVRFFGPDGFVGALAPTGTRFTSGCGGGTVLAFEYAEERPRGARVGITGEWDALPRKASPVAAIQTWKPVVGELLRELGHSKARVHLTRIDDVDLVGDGRPEIVVHAEHVEWTVPCRKQVIAGCRSGEDYDPQRTYSVVAVAVDGEPPFLPIEHWRIGPLTEVGNLFYLDVDGDGSMEVVVTTSYYEGNDISVFTLRDGRPQAVLRGDCSV